MIEECSSDKRPLLNNHIFCNCVSQSQKTGKDNTFNLVKPDVEPSFQKH